MYMYKRLKTLYIIYFTNDYFYHISSLDSFMYSIIFTQKYFSRIWYLWWLFVTKLKNYQAGEITGISQVIFKHWILHMLPKVLHIGYLPFSYKRIFRFSWYLSMHLIGRVLYTGSIPRINDTKGCKWYPPPSKVREHFSPRTVLNSLLYIIFKAIYSDLS